MIISKTQEWIVEEIGPGFATGLSDVTIAWVGRKYRFQKFRERVCAFDNLRTVIKK